jgi:hypothetical protein
LSHEKQIYFPFNFIVFLRYLDLIDLDLDGDFLNEKLRPNLDLNYRDRFITRTGKTRTGIFSSFIGITFVRNEIFS